MPKKQKSGLYRTKVKVGTDQTGKPVVKWVSGKTQKELEDAKREVRKNNTPYTQIVNCRNVFASMVYHNSSKQICTAV